MSDNRTDLPSPSAPNFNQRLRETIQTYLGRQGNPLDRGLTLRDLTETGLLKLRDGFTLKPGGGSSTLPLEPGPGLADEPDLTPPPTPTGLTATAAISHIIIEHDAPVYTQGRGHLRTRLYGRIVNAGDPLPTFADAVEIAQFNGSVYAHPSNPATTWRFWIKWETIDNVLSIDPAGGTNGVEAITGQDVSKLVLAMTGPGNPFKVVTEQLTLPDGTVVPVGTYTADAFIHNGQITNAKIANLAVDNAKIASVSASKITAGSIAVGRYIQSSSYVAGESGWRINGDGTAEFGAASIRGQLTASQIDTKGLSIKDANGNVIFSSGTPLSTSYISGLGGFATLDQITSSNVGTYIADAAIGTAQIGTLHADVIVARSIKTEKLEVGSVTNTTAYSMFVSEISLPSAQNYYYSYGALENLSVSNPVTAGRWYRLRISIYLNILAQNTAIKNYIVRIDPAINNAWGGYINFQRRWILTALPYTANGVSYMGTEHVFEITQPFYVNTDGFRTFGINLNIHAYDGTNPANFGGTVSKVWYDIFMELVELKV